MSNRDAIIGRVCRAKPSGEGLALPEQVPPAAGQDLLAVFARELEALQGELIRAATMGEAREQLARLVPPDGRPWFVAERPLAGELAEGLAVERADQARLAECQASVTQAEYVIADTATVGLRLDATQPRACHLLAEVHVVVAPLEGMLTTLAEALVDLERRGELPTAFVFVTGPSRTADIEKTLVIPAHGPKRLVVVLVG
ncbi:MAG: lactate utilization protein [Armatimonadia bacterium]